ncbi:hypothetical protein JOQ06_021103, partial [Pogonophryne albipinna]
DARIRGGAEKHKDEWKKRRRRVSSVLISHLAGPSSKNTTVGACGARLRESFGPIVGTDPAIPEMHTGHHCHWCGLNGDPLPKERKRKRGETG